MIYLVMGQIGSGKSVQSSMLAEHFKGVHLGMGQLLREHYADNPALSSGTLLDTDLVAQAVKKFLDAHADTTVFMDGFPRNLQQMQWLDEYITQHPSHELGAVIVLDTSSEEINRRLLARGREDDTPELIAVRKQVYEEEVMPVIDDYTRRGLVVKINGDQAIDAVDADIVEALTAVA